MNQIIVDLSVFVVISLFHMIWIGTLLGLIGIAYRSKGDIVASSKRRYSYSVHSANLILLVLLALSIPVAGMLAWSTVANPNGVVSRLIDSRPNSDVLVPEDVGQGFSPPNESIENTTGSVLETSLANSDEAFSSLRPSGQRFGEPIPEPAQALNDSRIAVAQPPTRAEQLWRQVVLIAPWISAIYLIGAAIMLGRVIVMVVGSQRIMKRAEPVKDSRILSLLGELSQRMELAVVPVLATTQRIVAPVVVGLWRPMILVPASLITGLTVQELEMILVHELTHIRRNDQWVVMLQRIVEAILFFHPTTWYLSSRLNRERELQCDDAVLAMGSSPVAYATSLCRAAEIALSLKGKRPASLSIDPISVAATGVSNAQLVSRVRRMLGESNSLVTTPALTIPKAVGASILAISVIVTAVAVWNAIPASVSQPTNVSEVPLVANTSSDASNQEDGSALNYEPQTSIAGIVVDRNDKPVEGALISASRRNKRFEVVSNSAGGFEMKVPKSLVRGLLIQAKTDEPTIRGSGYIPWDYVEEALTSQKIVLDSARNISVHVVDGNGTALPNIHVGAISSYSDIEMGQTGQDGKAELLVPRNIEIESVFAFSKELGVDYRSFGESRGEQATDAPKPPPLDEPIELCLGGVQTFSVVALDDSTEPIAAVEVYPFYLQKPGEPDSLNIGTIKSQSDLVNETTDADGVATIRWIPTWHTDALAFFAGREGYSRGRVDVGVDDADRDLSVQLSRKIPVKGIVTNQDGSPAKDLEIRFHGHGRRAGESRGSYSAANAYTNSDGEFAFLAEPHQAYMGQVQRSENVFGCSTLFSIEDQPLKEPLKFTVRPATRLFGRVSFGANKQPHANQKLWLSQYETLEIPIQGGPGTQLTRPTMSDMTQTNANGEFEFKIAYGKYRIYGDDDSKAIEFEVRNELEKEIILHSPHPPTAPLTGSVVTRGNSEQVPNAVITGLYTYSGAVDGLPTISGRGLTTDSEGNFSIERKWFPVLLCARSADGALGGFAEVAADKSSVTIEISPVRSVTGRLIDAKTGLPMSHREVVCKRQFPQASGGMMTTFHISSQTNDEGIFKIDEVIAEAKYDLSLTLEKKDGIAMHSSSLGDFVIESSQEQLDLGDVRYQAREDGPMPTSRDRAATSFGVAGLPIQRFGNAHAWAKLNRQQIMVVFGDPNSELVRQLWEFRLDNEQTSTAFHDFMVLAIPTSGKQIEQANVLADQLGLNLDLNGQDFKIAILDQDAKLISSTLSSELLDDNGVELSVSSVVRMLKQHILEPWDGRKLLDDALADAKRENKRVLVEETATWCGPCLLLSLYLDRTREIWSKDYVWVKMDHRWTGAIEIMQGLRGNAGGGVPWFVILDSDGKPLLTSNAADGNNMGFPSTPADFIHFRQMLKQTSIRMTDGDIDQMIEELSKDQKSTSLVPKTATEPKSATESQEESEAETIAGQVVDAVGTPIPNATIAVSLHQSLSTADRPNLSPPRIVKQWQVKSDDKGRFEVSRPDTELDPQSLNFFMTATAPGYFEKERGTNLAKAIARGDLGKIILQEGRPIRGKIKPPIGTNGPTAMTNAVVTLSTADNERDFSTTVRCDETGQFESTVPKNRAIQLVAASDQSAETRKEFGPFDEDVGEIELVSGTSVIGTVLDENNLPLSGVVVQLREYRIFGEGNEVSLGQSAVKSDANGRFVLPPHLGKAAICVVPQGQMRSAEDHSQSIYSDVQIPGVLPVRVELDGSQPTVEVTLKAGPTRKISGNVRWPDGTPVDRLEVRASVSAAGSGVDTSKAMTDTDGRYTVEVPSAAAWCSILVMGATDTKGVWHGAESDAHSDATQSGGQIATLRLNDSDIDNVNWVLRPPVIDTPASACARDFRKLSSGYSQLSDRYGAARRAAGDDAAQQIRIEVELNPAALIFDELFAFEEKYRGEPNALKALSAAWSWREAHTELDSAPNRAALKAAELIMAHYLDAEDLDLCIGSGRTQWLDIDYKLFKTVAEKSPHRQARATALYNICLLSSQELIGHKFMEQQNWNPKALYPAVISRLKSLDPVELEKLRRDSAAAIEEQFGDIKVTFVCFSTQWDPLEYWRDTSREAERPLYASLVNELSAQMAKLADVNTKLELGQFNIEEIAFKNAQQKLKQDNDN